MPAKPRNFTALAPIQRVVHPSQRSIIRSVIVELIALITALILLVPTWSLIIIIVPFVIVLQFVFDRILASCCSATYPGFERLAAWDAVWFGQQGDAVSPISTVLINVENGLSFDEIRSLILQRVVFAKDEYDRLMYPRFMQRIVGSPFGYGWIYDKEFDPGEHILAIPGEVESLETLRAFMLELTHASLAPTRPLWTIHVLPNLRNGTQEESVLVVRFHQALSDGISLVKILCRSVTDKTQEVYHIKSRFGGQSLSINTFRSMLMASVYFLTHVIFAPKLDWRNPFYDQHSEDYQNQKDPEEQKSKAKKYDLFWTEAVPLRVVDRISLVTRNPLNNIVLTCLSGALRSCLTSQGVRRPPNIQATIPVDLRKPLSSVTSSVKMGNQFVLLNVKLPTGTIGSIPRLWKIRQEEDQLKNTSHSTSIYWIIQILGYILPARMLSHLALRSAASSVLVANLPGPDAQLCLNGKRVSSLIFWPPPVTLHNRLCLSVFTYADKLQIGIAVDPELCDAKSLATEFAHEIKELSELLSNRRAPGEIKPRTAEIHATPQLLRSRIMELQKTLAETQMKIGSQSGQKTMNNWSEQATKMETMKEELMEMLSMARRRKSIMEGVSMDFEEDDDIASELRSSMPSSARRRASSIGSLENVRVVAVTPTRLSEDVHEFPQSVTRSISKNVMSSGEERSSVSHSASKQLKVGNNAHIIYISRESLSSD